MTDLVPVDPFALAEKVSRSNLIPQAYRGKPADAAVCIMYGAEVGLPPMTALQRIIVINGKPTLDAQGMSALIRGSGHSLVGEVTDTEAKVTGKRGDNGDTMSFSFSMEDANRAGLVKPGPWRQYPKAMLWARAVSQLARQLFPDVLMGMSYVPEEIGGEVDEATFTAHATVHEDGVVDVHVPHPALIPEATDFPPLVDADTGEIVPEDDVVDAEVVEANRSDPTPEHLPRSEPEPAPVPIASSAQDLKVELQRLITDQPPGETSRLRAHLLSKFGPAPNRTLEQLQESVNIAAGWPSGPNPTDPTF